MSVWEKRKVKYSSDKRPTIFWDVVVGIIQIINSKSNEFILSLPLKLLSGPKHIAISYT